jgi:hypothetical protein
MPQNIEKSVDKKKAKLTFFLQFVGLPRIIIFDYNILVSCNNF